MLRSSRMATDAMARSSAPCALRSASTCRKRSSSARLPCSQASIACAAFPLPTAPRNASAVSWRCMLARSSRSAALASACQWLSAARSATRARSHGNSSLPPSAK